MPRGNISLRGMGTSALVVVHALCASNARAADESVVPATATTIVAQMDDRHRIPREWTRVSMALRDKSGVDSVRLFEELRVTDPARATRQWLRFDAPGDVKDLRILSVADAGPADHWVYSPKADKVRKMQSADADERVLDSDLTFADLFRRSWQPEQLARTADVEFEGHACYRLVRAPPGTDATRPAALEVLLRKDILVVVRLRIAAADGTPLKEVRATNLVRISGDVWRADKITVTDVRRGHRTTLFVQERRLDVAPPADLFDPRYLPTSRLR